MSITCGIDWASDHHDVAPVDQDGTLVAKKRVSDDAQGYRDLLDLLAVAGDSPQEPIPVAIETPRGLFVACLRSSGRPVHAINPLSAARYRERRRVTRAKSDHADAMVLANILRTDAHEHPPLPADSEQGRAITVLARAQQDAVGARPDRLTAQAAAWVRPCPPPQRAGQTDRPEARRRVRDPAHRPGRAGRGRPPAGRVTEVTAAAKIKDSVEVRLARGTKPADGDKVAAKLKDQKPDCYLTRFEPFLDKAHLDLGDRRPPAAAARSHCP